ncbi:MAG: hypothetical protein OEZ39_16210 [Gammaproteobacteria bacterium]|nr:hypothetical protein [Gammaproteobacteria bacterium]MDH5653403.1 hypothetical protein [Gammaproteobacteria bacterium]
MDESFKLSNTYEMLLEFKDVSRVIRIDVFHGIENGSLYRARVWDQTTYNLYPTFANIAKEGGLKNEMYSCDEINREITTIIAEEPTLITGKVYSSESEFLEYIKGLIGKYHDLCNK